MCMKKQFMRIEARNRMKQSSFLSDWAKGRVTEPKAWD